MAEWINLNPNNSFVNKQLPLLREIVLLGVTAGRQSHQILVGSKLSTYRTVRILTEFNEL